MRNPGRHSECSDCRFHNRLRENPLCGDCSAGEFFEARLRVRELNENDLMSMFARMNDDC